MAPKAPKYAIILAAGKGTRMQSSTLHKVCFPIDGRPAINRALDAYRACGIRCPIVVVGTMAGQVIETMGREHEGAIFVYQAEQLGTAHAARQGARVLETLGGEEVLLAAGDWSQYVRAAALRLQKKFSDQPLRGADLVVGGNIPIAAGLSSSSALVVGTAEALVAVNRLDTFPSQLVNLCGEGEWYVGTRGGSADHAAIKYGRKGRVVKVTFFEFALKEIVPFPDGYVLAVCDSGVKARKTSGARDQFNHRVSCYRLGLRLVRRLFPQYAPLLHHLRDVNTRNLRVPLSWIYRILLHLPERATRGEIETALSGEDLRDLFETHRPPQDGIYPLRGVVLYGLAECERSRLFADALREGRAVEIGRLMSVSHDGDRVTRFTAQGEPVPYHVPVSNSYLLNLIEDLESGDPQRVLRAQLQWQPGAYRCSIPEIDRMVDIAMGTKGTIGAQLAGAGLGGCMMVLTRRESFPLLRRALIERYYGPAGMPPAILECRPISGSSVLLLPPSPAGPEAVFPLPTVVDS